jgi:outer membrane protein OmpA-like peptidoglycan-associated protein
MTLGCGSLFAQQTNTLYFMKGVPERSSYNPAFQPDYNFWIDLPVLPNWNINLGNNSLNYNKLFRDNMFFLDMNVGDYRNTFLNDLPNTTRVNFEVSMDLLGFGFKTGKSYWNFNLTEKVLTNGFIPKDLFAIPLKGPANKTFDLSSLGVDFTMYLEAGLGWSYQINDRLNVGVKGKLLMGQANVGTAIDKLKLTTDRWKWDVQAAGKIHASLPIIDIPIDGQGQIEFDSIAGPSNLKVSDYVKAGLPMQNWGAGVDLGVSYEVVKNLTLSAAVVDLGFIRWKQNALEASLNNFNFTYEGIEGNLNEDKSVEDAFEEIIDKAKDDFKAATKNPSKQGYTTKLNTRLNVGAEYAPFDDKLGVGLLYSHLITPSASFNELTASLNWRPCRWFNPAITYSILDNKFHTVGAGLQMKFGPWVTYVAIDHVPVGAKSLSKQYIPMYMKGTNIQAGITLAFGGGKGNKDDDGDGVKNKKDKCPFTPVGYIVDKYGCPIDTDGDGVADNVDLCPDTPQGVQVDAHGCPVDTDGDGVPDYLDKCPNTSEGVQVDENGCPLDSDGDGVPDYLDKCPDTPAEAKGTVDENGCPKDSDGDGVPDYLDKCPNTPDEAKATIDEHGCPKDSDGDGVPDYLDKCPNTPDEARGTVDENGCPKDTDGDGIPDYQDNCPTVKGVKSNKGCPEVKAAVKQLFKKALNGIQFETGKAKIKTASNALLNQIVKVMQDNPDYYLTISGHTDNVGKPEANQKLSEERAAAVRTYLVDHGIDASRITSFGFGDTQPIDTNKTAAGRAKNRRVDFEVKFEAVVEDAKTAE